MATTPWNNNVYPLKGTNVPGVVMYAGTFTTDSTGKVTSVSGLNPGVTVSGTSTTSGVYSLFFNTGSSINSIGVNAIGRATNDLPGVGASSVQDSFNRILFLQAHRVHDLGIPTTDLFQTTQKDSRTGVAKIQYLKQNVLNANNLTTQSGVFAPAVAASMTVEVFALAWVHKDVT